MRSIQGGPGERQVLGRMRGWLGALPAAISVHRGPDHHYEYANPRMLELLQTGDPFGRPAREVLAHAKLAALQDVVYATGKPWFSEEIPLEREGESPRWVSWQWQPLRGEDGQIDGTVAMAWDVTEQVLATLVDPHASAVLQSLDVVVYEFRTRPARMVYINSGASQVLGYDSADWRQRDFWHRIVLPEDRERAMAVRREAIERLEDHVIEYRVTRKDGGVRWLRDRTQVKDDPDGPGVILRGVILDVTEQKQLEAAARLAVDREHEARRHQSIASLAAGIAVDIEDLLIDINTCASLLEVQLDPDHPSYRMIRGVMRRFDLTQERLERLKAIARPPTPHKQLDLSAATRELLEQTRHAGPSIHAELAPDLPRVGVDPVQLRAAVEGLLANGIEAMGDEPGEVCVSTDLIELTEEELAHWSDTPRPAPGRYVRLAVADQGAGMPDTVRQRAFEPYFSTKGPGRGLGMSSALGVAQAAGGSARVNTRPGFASVVELLFPAAR